jgi:hypothetical protein
MGLDRSDRLYELDRNGLEIDLSEGRSLPAITTGNHLTYPAPSSGLELYCTTVEAVE